MAAHQQSRPAVDRRCLALGDLGFLGGGDTLFDQRPPAPCLHALLQQSRTPHTHVQGRAASWDCSVRPPRSACTPAQCHLVASAELQIYPCANREFGNVSQNRQPPSPVRRQDTPCTRRLGETTICERHACRTGPQSSAPAAMHLRLARFPSDAASWSCR